MKSDETPHHPNQEIESRDKNGRCVFCGSLDTDESDSAFMKCTPSNCPTARPEWKEISIGDRNFAIARAYRNQSKRLKEELGARAFSQRKFLEEGTKAFATLTRVLEVVEDKYLGGKR